MDIPLALIEYFDKLELEGIKLTEGQKKWYIAKKNTLHDDMMREYPSTPHEAFAASQEGYWYSTQLKELYANGRVTQVSYDRSLLVHTSFDLGVRDFCAIWFFQMTKQGEIRIIDHFQRTDTTLELIAQILKEKGYTYGVHLWPFDANQRDRAGITYVQQAREFNLNGVVLERSGFLDGINLTRMIMSKMWFDSVKCKEGLSALASYKKKWNNQTGGYTSEAVHDNASHSADALRYLAQGYKFVSEDTNMESEMNALRNYFSFR